jgi:hypothetical protein
MDNYCGFSREIKIIKTYQATVQESVQMVNTHRAEMGQLDGRFSHLVYTVENHFLLAIATVNLTLVATEVVQLNSIEVSKSD